MTIVQELGERIQQRVKEIKVAINDYDDTVHAIIGFVNLYFLDDKTYKPRPYVIRFQGRHLTPLGAGEQSGEAGVGADVCPDLGLIIEDNKGILGEVKKNFPKEIERANKEFVQLKGYDQNLTGWPVVNQQVQSHEVILLVHLTTSAYAIEFYREQLPHTGIVFERPFSIVEFGSISQAQEFFFFKTALGAPTEIGEEERLKYGVSVPMIAFVEEYARAKLYDAEPPIPYLVQLIWIHVVTPLAAENPMFEGLRKNRKLEVHLTTEDIVDRLDEGFSFRHWHKQAPDRQRRILRTEWVREACQFLVESGDAEWADDSEKIGLVVFFQKYDDVEDHFIASYATLEEQKAFRPMLPGFEPTETADSR